MTDTEQELSQGKSAIRKKLIAIMKTTPTLAKTAKNDDGWNFVPIDAYYETPAKALAEAGLSWTSTELAVEFFQPNNLLYRFQFDVYDDEGNEWENAMRLTMVHEIEGPQTAGKVVSYMEKTFLRMLLKLVTGEPDADVARKKPAQISKGAAFVEEKGLDVEALMKAIKAAPSPEKLQEVIAGSAKSLTYAKKNDPDIYKRVGDARMARMKEMEDAQQ